MNKELTLLAHCHHLDALFPVVAGTSARSSSIRLVLGSICWQIAAMYKMDFTDIPVDYPGLVSYFHDMLRVCAPADFTCAPVECLYFVFALTVSGFIRLMDHCFLCSEDHHSTRIAFL